MRRIAQRGGNVAAGRATPPWEFADGKKQFIRSFSIYRGTFLH